MKSAAAAARTTTIASAMPANLRTLAALRPARGGVAGSDAIRDEGIGDALLAEGRHRPVAADERDVVAERPQLVADGVDQGVVAAAREIGAADRAGEQHVADQR